MSGLTETIAKANGFELGSLPANQRGELTPEQNIQLFSKLYAPLIFVFFSLGYLYYLLYQQGYLVGYVLTANFTEIVLQMNTGLKIFGGIIIGVLIWSIVIIIQIILDVIGRTVQMIEGLGYRKITTSTDKEGSQTTRLYYVIEGKKFRVQRGGFSVFEDGKQYKAYFSPRRKVLLNVEAVE